MKKFLSSLFRPDHALVTFAVLLLMWLLALLSVNISFLDPVGRAIGNFRMTDVFYEITAADQQRDTSDVITLVDMTNVFDRTQLADIVDQIQAQEPAVLGIDIIFDGLREDSLGNERLIETVCSTTSPTIWAFKLMDWSDEADFFRGAAHSFFTDYVDIDEGFTNVQRDINGGTVRSFGVRRPQQDDTVYSLPARVALAFTGDSATISKTTDCTINYQATEFPVVPHDSIAAYADLIRGHVVLLGATADLRDQHFTPLGSMAGIRILAYTVQTLVEHQAPREFSTWQTWLFTILIIWLVQLIQYHVSTYLYGHRLRVCKYLGSSGLGVTVLTFFILVLLVGVSYWLYTLYNIYCNTAWAIIGIALLGNARQVHSLVVNVLADRFHWSWLNQSLYIAK